MKKMISFFVCITMIFSLAAPAFASPGECDCGFPPVVTVRGFGSTLNLVGEDGTETNALSFDAKKLSPFLKAQVKRLTELAEKRDIATFLGGLYDAFDLFFENIRCDSEGNSIRTIKAAGTDSPEEDKHSGHSYGSVARGTEGDDYVFEYDFRLDPTENAEILNEYIEGVKKLTGHSKVVLTAHSEGTCVTSAYLVKYGTASVEKLIFVGAAVNGISLIGNVFNQNITLEDKSDALEKFAASALGFDGVNDFVNLLLESLNKTGILPLFSDALETLMHKTIRDVYRDYLADLFAVMPGMWSFVPDEYYESAKQTMFEGSEKYAALCEKLDRYHYGVSCEIGQLLQRETENGLKLAILGGYGVSTIPVTREKESSSDFLIDTRYTTFGATCAPFGEKLDGGDRLSPDGIADASTCLFPETTWLIKYQTHNDFCEPMREFINWLILFDGQPTVHSSADYPQFLTCSKHEKLVAVEEDSERSASGSFAQRLLNAVTALIKAVMKLLSGLLTAEK